MEKSKLYEPPKPGRSVEQLRELLKDPNLFVSYSDNPVGVNTSPLDNITIPDDVVAQVVHESIVESATNDNESVEQTLVRSCISTSQN